MKVKAILSIVLLVQPLFIKAFETDQYNLPKVPLEDIGYELDKYTAKKIEKALYKLNERIKSIDICLGIKDNRASNKDCSISRKNREKLVYLRSEKALAKAVFKELGDGLIFLSKTSSWVEHHKFPLKPVRYKTSFRRSIYVTAPLNYMTLSSTIKIHGVEFGTDKIAHIFQQGYSYYKKYGRGLRKGLTKNEALRKAVKWGQKTEKTYYGTWVSGVYSNADLAANYAGLKFYQGLTSKIKIGEKLRPAILVQKEGVWAFNKNSNLKANLLKPFISKHLNEAYNPNKYFKLFKFNKVIRRVVRKQSCKQWIKRYPKLSKYELEATTKSLELWYGEDYGFSRSKNFITIANTCFSSKPKSEKK